MDEEVDCLVCAEPCCALAVFGCGHFVCYSCGLRIHSISKGGCPVCRKTCDSIVITRTLPSHWEGELDDIYTAGEITAMKNGSIYDRKLQCSIDDRTLAKQVAKMYEYVCPVSQCWRHGEQEPFVDEKLLIQHLAVDHKLHYCSICLEHRPAFLCEQRTYTNESLRQHLEGRCRMDGPSFTGHPPCKFCNNVRFYDGEMLLKHMQREHFTCDLCNRGEFIFTFYQNHAKLHQHFERAHVLCDHPDCSRLDAMERVFASEFELLVHKQQVHGVKMRGVPLSALGGSTSTPSAPGNARAASRGVPETGANTNALQITFDHVFRTEVIDVMSTKTRGTGGGGGGHRGGHNNNNGQQVMINGIPKHFHSNGVLKPITYRSTAQSSNDAAADARTSTGATTQASGGKSAFRVRDNEANNRGGNKAPAERAKQEKQLEEVLQRHLKEPPVYTRFRGYTADFIRGTMLSTEYFSSLRDTFFPDKSVFDEVFPLLVSTIPVKERKEALLEVQKMRSAPEVQRLEKVKQEEEALAKAKEIEAEQRATRLAGRGNVGALNKHHKKEQKNAWFKNGTGNNNSNNNAGGGIANRNANSSDAAAQGSSTGDQGGRSAWSNMISGSNATTTSASSTNASSGPTPSALTDAGRGNWMTETSASPTLPSHVDCFPSRVPPSLGDVGSFPALPSSPVRRGPQPKKKTKGGNAWFSQQTGNS